MGDTVDESGTATDQGEHTDKPRKSGFYDLYRTKPREFLRQLGFDVDCEVCADFDIYRERVIRYIESRLEEEASVTEAARSTVEHSDDAPELTDIDQVVTRTWEVKVDMGGFGVFNVKGIASIAGAVAPILTVEALSVEIAGDEDAATE